MDELFEMHLGLQAFEMGVDNGEESSGESEDDYWPA